jgi:hypothetical protein
MFLNRFFLLFLLFFSSLISVSQEVILPPDYIKTVVLQTNEGNGFYPIMQKSGMLHVAFDDIQANEKDYYYLIEHCDRHWKTSDLLPTEFVRGYQKEQIRSYQNSVNTLQFYTHYDFQIPNEQTQLLISGNYRLSVLNDNDEVIFTRYFIVYEPITTVGVSVHQRRDVSVISEQQSVQFNINHPGLSINNPYEEIYPMIFQNFDFSTAIYDLKPQFIRGDQLLYKYDKETAYFGGNEFLNFDTKEMLMTNFRVAAVVSGKDLYESILYTDVQRAFDPYTYFPDINGNFLVNKARSNENNLDADYSRVAFSLDADEFFDKQVYVYGAFNNYRLTDENRMIYNPELGIYQAKILLKQGFYNYNFVTLNSHNQINSVELNGSFDETENDYQVIVYYVKFGSRYDRVIGYGMGNSSNLKQ